MCRQSRHCSKRIFSKNLKTHTHTQLDRMLILEDNREGELLKIFIEDLMKWIREVQTPQTEIVLLLDANKKWGISLKITMLIHELQLYNVFETNQDTSSITHPCLNNPERGTTIDFCLVSQSVVEHIHYVTVLAYDLQTLGDHRGIMIDLDVKGLLNATHSGLSITSVRILYADNPKAEKLYLESVTKGFCRTSGMVG